MVGGGCFRFILLYISSFLGPGVGEVFLGMAYTVLEGLWWKNTLSCFYEAPLHERRAHSLGRSPIT